MLGYRLPGTKTIPDQIAVNKRPYYNALEAADRAFSDGGVDLSELEELINSHLAVQLLEIHNSATGKNHKDRQAIAKTHEWPTVKTERNAPKTKFSFAQHIEMHPVIYGFLGAIALAIATYIFGL